MILFFPLRRQTLGQIRLNREEPVLKRSLLCGTHNCFWQCECFYCGSRLQSHESPLVQMGPECFETWWSEGWTHLSPVNRERWKSTQFRWCYNRKSLNVDGINKTTEERNYVMPFFSVRLQLLQSGRKNKLICSPVTLRLPFHRLWSKTNLQALITTCITWSWWSLTVSSLKLKSLLYHPKSRYINKTPYILPATIPSC